MKNRMLRALGALTLTLALALTVFPLWPAAQEPAAQEDYAGYLVILGDAPQVASIDLLGQATLMAAHEEREELLPLSQGAGVYKAADLSQVQNLVWSGQVLSAELDQKAELAAVSDLETDHSDPTKPDDPYFINQSYEYQFYLKDTDKHGISVRAAWDAGLTGDGVTVAVIDSGLNGEHIDAPAKQARGRYYYYREEANGRYPFTINGQIHYYNYYSSDYVVDDMGHGTNVAGLIAAQKDNGVGIAGIAPDVTFMPIRCFTAAKGYLGGYTSNLISGVTYAMDNGANIINMSWGLQNDSPALRAVLTQAANQGCILVAATGNSGGSVLQYPAAYDNVIAVSSTNKDGGLSDFSPRNGDVDVCAPGGQLNGHQIWTIGYSSNTSMVQGDGTSFAAPMVVAVAALLKQADPAMTQADFLALLEGNCDPVTLRSGDDPSYAGAGLLNVEKLLDAMGCTGSTLQREGDALTFRAAYHPVQNAGHVAPQSAILMVAAYNDQGHLLDSQTASAALSGYGAYSLSARFDDPRIATLRAFYLQDDETLAAAAPATQVAVR